MCPDGWTGRSPGPSRSKQNPNVRSARRPVGGPFACRSFDTDHERCRVWTAVSFSKFRVRRVRRTTETLMNVFGGHRAVRYRTRPTRHRTKSVHRKNLRRPDGGVVALPGRAVRQRRLVRAARRRVALRVRAGLGGRGLRPARAAAARGLRLRARRLVRARAAARRRLGLRLRAGLGRAALRARAGRLRRAPVPQRRPLPRGRRAARVRLPARLGRRRLRRARGAGLRGLPGARRLRARPRPRAARALRLPEGRDPLSRT